MFFTGQIRAGFRFPLSTPPRPLRVLLVVMVAIGYGFSQTTPPADSPSISCSCIPQAAAPASPCSPQKKIESCDEQKARAQLFVLLTQARNERHLGHWDKAADLFSKAMQTCSSTTSSPPGSKNAKQDCAPGLTAVRPVDSMICPATAGGKPPDAVNADNYATYARENFCYASSQMSTWWWIWGAYFPPLR